jgi:hypothetical protein
MHELRVRRDGEARDDRRQVNDEEDTERRRVPAYQRQQPGDGEQQQRGEQRVPAPGQRRVLARRARGSPGLAGAGHARTGHARIGHARIGHARIGHARIGLTRVGLTRVGHARVRPARRAPEHEQPAAADDHARPADDAEQHRRRHHRVRRRVAGDVLADRGGHGRGGTAREPPRDQAVQSASRGGRLVGRIGAVSAAAAQVAQASGLAQRGKQDPGAGQAVTAGGPPVPRGRDRHDDDAPEGGQPDRDEQRGVGDHPVR